MSKETLSNHTRQPNRPRPEQDVILTSLTQYEKEIEGIPILSYEQEQALAESMERGRIAHALGKLRNADTVIIQEKGLARIGKETAQDLISELGILKQVALISHDEPISKKDTMPVTVLDSIQVKSPIQWHDGLVDKLQNLQKDGEKAKETLIVSNLRLVIDSALDYFYNGLTPLEDAVQEGNIGLIRAVGKFERFRHLKFSTLATYWINQAIKRAIDNTENAIRVSVGISEQYARIKKIQASFRQEENREPTINEIAARFKKPPEVVETILAAKKMSQPDSLDMPLNGGSEDGLYPEFSLKDILPDRKEMSPETAAEISDLQRRVRIVLQKLYQSSPRKAMYLSVRFGLEGKEHSQKELVERFNVKTPQGVSVLQRSSLQAFKRLTEEVDPALLDLLTGF